MIIEMFWIISHPVLNRATPLHIICNEYLQFGYVNKLDT